MDKTRAAMQQALEALENCEEKLSYYGTGRKKGVITALREALDRSGEANEMVVGWDRVKPEAIASDPLYQQGFVDGVEEGRNHVAEQAEQEPDILSKSLKRIQSLERQLKIAQQQWDNCREYALELAERLFKYEGGSPMLLNFEQAEQEPVAWWNGKETVWFEHELDGHAAPDGCTIPLYAAPQPVKLAISEEAFNWIDANAPMFVRDAVQPVKEQK